jgi:hypothetical protein
MIRVALELIFLSENEHSILVKDEEGGEAKWIAKRDVEYDDFVMVPGMISVFEIYESVAIEAGFV